MTLRYSDLTPKPVTSAVQCASVAFEVPVAKIKGPRRSANLFLARAAAAWVAHKAGVSTPRIARDMGGRDHTTIVNAIRRAEQMRADDEAFRIVTDDILQRIAG